MPGATVQEGRHGGGRERFAQQHVGRGAMPGELPQERSVERHPAGRNVFAPEALAEVVQQSEAGQRLGDQAQSLGRLQRAKTFEIGVEPVQVHQQPRPRVAVSLQQGSVAFEVGGSRASHAGQAPLTIQATMRPS